jgi:tRNA U34 2-thiouridine synthase MnmA/TrmU
MYNGDKKKRGHAISLFSGGLDSILSILLIQRQNIEVTALTFMTHFGCDLSDRSSCGHDPFPAAEKFGFNVKLMHLGQKFVAIVKAPKYGYGKNMNPCIDCRLLMIEEAKQFMELVGADFVFTGEVVGQRPKSQRKDVMNMVAKKCGLDGYLVRPLSAKLLPATEPEKSGLLNRDELEDFSGRSRKRQMELAKKLGVYEYPSPAGGCLLTEPGYSRRLKDLIIHKESFDFNDLNLLRHGRHFRLSDDVKIIVGRNAEDNEKLSELIGDDYYILEALGTGSPITVIPGKVDPEHLHLAAAITARYCRKKNEKKVEITYTRNKVSENIIIEPANPDKIKKYHI